MRRARLTYDELLAVAKERERIHANHATSRPLSPDYEVKGLMGEEAFAWRFGFGTEYLDLKPQGDGRIDFHTPAGTVDVKTAEKPYYLFAEEGVKHADILVLASYNPVPTRCVSLLGWEYSDLMLTLPKRDFGHGIVNHYKPRHKLRPMQDLHDLCRRALRTA